MLIQVTQEHINCGERFISSKCPLALAIKQQAGLDEVYVGPSIVEIVESHQERYIRLPQIAIDFRLDFDCGQTVQPFEFEIKL